MRRFLDPKNDLAFKKIFGSEKSGEILADFLNGVMELPEEKRIEVATIIDPYQIPAKVLTDKLSIVDVKCKDAEGRIYIVEMQLLSKDAFLSRVVYNVSKSYAGQLKISVPYSTLKEVIGVAIVNFELFHELPGQYLSCHRLVEEKTKQNLMKQIRFHFLEIPKFHKKLEELESNVDKWIYFLKHAENMEAIPRELEGNLMEQAFQIAERAKMTDEEESRYEALETDYRDRLSEMELSKKEGIEEGMEKGMKKGREEGIEEGMEKGMKKGRKEGLEEGIEKGVKKTARKMLENEMEISMIARITGLSVEEIEEMA